MGHDALNLAQSVVAEKGPITIEDAKGLLAEAP